MQERSSTVLQKKYSRWKNRLKRVSVIFKDKKEGIFRSTLVKVFGAYYLPNIINPFVKMNPNIHVLASILPTEQVVSNTANLENDIGFLSYPLENNKLVIREVIEDRLEIITPPGHPLARNSSIEPCDLEGGRSLCMKRGQLLQ